MGRIMDEIQKKEEKSFNFGTLKIKFLTTRHLQLFPKNEMVLWEKMGKIYTRFTPGSFTSFSIFAKSFTDNTLRK